MKVLAAAALLLTLQGNGGVRSPSALAISICTATVKPCVARVGQAFTVAADHSGADTVGYRIYLHANTTGANPDGTLPVSALQAPGVISFAFGGGLRRGSYQIAISAYNDANAEMRSTVVLLNVTPSGK